MARQKGKKSLDITWSKQDDVLAFGERLQVAQPGCICLQGFRRVIPNGYLRFQAGVSGAPICIGESGVIGFRWDRCMAFLLGIVQVPRPSITLNFAGDTIMPMTMKKVESEALNLDIHSRANLVGKLLLSLDEPTVSEVEQL